MAIQNEDLIQLALRDVRNKKFNSIRAAAIAYSINIRTLQYRARGKESRAQARVKQQLLSLEQENMLVRWILDCENLGHPINHNQIREMATLVSKISGGPDFLGRDWVSRFLNRHQNLKTKLGVKIDTLRIKGTSLEVLSAWFEHYRRVCSEYQIPQANRYNIDETGIALGVCANQLVVGTVDTNRSYLQSPENREWVSVVECISSSGRVLRPLVIFKGKSI